MNWAYPIHSKFINLLNSYNVHKEVLMFACWFLNVHKYARTVPWQTFDNVYQATSSQISLHSWEACLSNKPASYK